MSGAGLLIVGGAFVEWAISKTCDHAGVSAHKALSQRLREGKIEPNHDIERAVLRAHYQTLHFIVCNGMNDGLLDDFNPGAGQARKLLRQRLANIDKAKADELASALSDDWQSVIGQSFDIPTSAKTPGAAARAIPQTHCDAALGELLSMTQWTDPERVDVEDLVRDEKHGWAIAFCGYLHQGLKDNGAFTAIYTQYQLEGIARQNKEILAVMAPSPDLQSAMDAMAQVLEKVRDTTTKTHTDVVEIKAMMQQVLAGQNLINESQQISVLMEQVETLEKYQSKTKDQLMGFLQYALPRMTITDGQITEKLPDLFAEVLKNLEDMARQMATPSNDPQVLQDLRVQVYEFLEKYKIDKARDALAKARKKRREQAEAAARDEAELLVVEAKIETTAMNTITAMDLYARAAMMIDPYDWGQAFRWLLRGADLGYQRGKLSGERHFLDKAITLFEQALALTGDPKHASCPLKGRETEWAGTLNNLGNTYKILGERGGDAMLDKALTAYELALQEYTQDKVRLSWATTQNNLGEAYRTLGERGDDAMLERAVAVYELALQERTREKVPLNWAGTQNNLGAACLILGERGDDVMLDKAVTAFELALQEYTQEKVPLQWAMTQNNLGNAYATLGNRGDDAMLAKAIIAYELTLQEYTQDKVPLDWAGTQNNLGNAYQILGERGDDAMLDKAITAYELALQEWTQDKVPLQWAMTMENLGLAYWSQGKKKRAERCLRDALSVFRSLGAPYYQNKAENTLRQWGFDPDQD